MNKRDLSEATAIANDRFSHFKVVMENSKWSKLVSKESILQLKGQNDFKFSNSNLSKHFGIPDKRMSELLKYYEIEIVKLTKNVKLTTEEWVKECEIIHGSYFDYSMSEYINGHTLVTIGCPIHGKIKVNPNRHKRGSKCKRCSAKENTVFKAISKDIFYKEASEIHNNKYDYSLSEDFNDVHEQITIICPIHGEFRQIAYSHRKGSGCEECSYIQRGEVKRISFEEYVNRAEEKFGKRYRYLESSYTKISDDITYVCDTHGEVTQLAGTHLISRGCAKCFVKIEQSSTQEFTQKAILKHNNFYTYDRTDYNKSNESIIIRCPFHGDFIQLPNTHLNGAGCKTCANIKSNIGYSNLAKEDIENSKYIKCSFYLLKFNTLDMEYYKIGMSTNLKERIRKLKGSHKASVELLYELESNLFDCAKYEGELLKKYKKYNKKGEVPYRIEGSTECLSIDTPIEEIITHLKTLT